jgi:hypothetical protein
MTQAEKELTTLPGLRYSSGHKKGRLKILSIGIKPVIDKVFGFDEAKSAYAYLESAAHLGKIVIRVM